jgi:hypothetical protein
VVDEDGPVRSFTLLLVPTTPIGSADRWEEVLRALTEMHPGKVDAGVQVEVIGKHRASTMQAALNYWKEHAQPLGYGTAAVHLKLIDGQPLPPAPKPLPLPGPDRQGHTWLRFMPDFECSPALWYLDPNDLDGGDHGLAEHLLEVISQPLANDIEIWIAEWVDWYDVDQDDQVPPLDWLTAGNLLVERLKAELEPLGYRIHPRLL